MSFLFLLWIPGSKTQGTIQLRMTLPVNKGLRHLATDSHPSLLRSSDVDSSLPGNNGGQPRKILNGRKSWEEANSGFVVGNDKHSGNCLHLWINSGGSKGYWAMYHWLFWKNNEKWWRLRQFSEMIEIQEWRQFHDHTEEKCHHREDKQISTYTLNDKKQRNKVCSMFIAGQWNCPVNSTVNKINLLKPSDSHWYGICGMKGLPVANGSSSLIALILCTLHIEGTQLVLAEGIHMRVKTFPVK